MLVAVSGGCDSVSLLHLLRFAADDAGLRVSAAHFDHAMRPGSARDAAWVRGLCRAWGVDLVEARAEVAPRSEEAARDARYAFLREAQARCGAPFLATAHHADDQAETVLFRVLRGTGLTGLAGIPPRDASGLVRPLLPFPRAEIRAYARDNGLRWRADPSNALPDPARNRIRLELLPYVERHLAPGARRGLARLAQLAARGRGGVGRRAPPPPGGNGFGRRTGRSCLSANGLRLMIGPCASACCARVLRRLGVTPDRMGTRLAIQFISDAPSGRVLTLPGGMRITTEFGTARVERVTAETVETIPDAPLVIPVEGAGEGRFVVGGRAGTARWTCGPAEGADGAGETVHIAPGARALSPHAARADSRRPHPHPRGHAPAEESAGRGTRSPARRGAPCPCWRTRTAPCCGWPAWRRRTDAHPGPASGPSP